MKITVYKQDQVTRLVNVIANRCILLKDGKISYNLTRAYSTSVVLKLTTYNRIEVRIHLLDATEKPYFMDFYREEHKDIIYLEEVKLDYSRVIIAKAILY